MGPVDVLHGNMRSAFRQRLQSCSGLPSKVAWEGITFTPVVGTAYMTETHRPSFSDVRALGAGGTIEHRNTAVIVLFFPNGRGTLDIETAAGKLLAHFAPGTALNYGSSSGVVVKAERSPLLQEEKWLSCPVTVTISAHTTN